MRAVLVDLGGAAEVLWLLVVLILRILWFAMRLLFWILMLPLMLVGFIPYALIRL